MAISVSLMSRRLAVAPTLPARRSRRALVARAHLDDDDGPLPLLRLPRQEVDLKRMRKLKPTPSLGGATIGEELSLIYRQHQAADRRAAEMQAGLHSGNWAGDEYIGGRWNVLSVLYLIFLATPLAGLLFAYLTYGSLWGVMPGSQVPGL